MIKVDFVEHRTLRDYRDKSFLCYDFMSIKENKREIRRQFPDKRKEKNIHSELLYFHTGAYRRGIEFYVFERNNKYDKYVSFYLPVYIYISEYLRVACLLFFFSRHFHVRIKSTHSVLG